MPFGFGELDRGGRDGQQRLWHAFDAPHQGGADLPQDRQSASGPVASRNGYIVPTNSRLMRASATGSIRAPAKWCRSGEGSEAAASRFTISDQPHFPLHILRSMRREVDALLGFLLPESKPEGAQTGAQIRTSPTSPTKPVRRGDAAREAMPG